MSKQLCFFADVNCYSDFLDESNGIHLYYLKGADFEEKGQCIQIIAEILKDSDYSLYYSPYEKNLPCGLYIPEYKSFITSDNCEPNTKMNCKYYDISQILTDTPHPIKEIIGYTMNQSNSYHQRSEELIKVADILLKEYLRLSREALHKNRLEGYTVRKISSMLPKLSKKGSKSCKSISGISCSGYKLTEFPDDYNIINLNDDYLAASKLFVSIGSLCANKLGYDTIISKAVESESSPKHLIIPEARLAFVSNSQIFPNKYSHEKINLNRYYTQESLIALEHYISFFRDFIIKTYKEAVLYARICFDIKNQGRKILMPFINDAPVSKIAADIIYDITNQK